MNMEREIIRTFELSIQQNCTLSILLGKERRGGGGGVWGVETIKES